MPLIEILNRHSFFLIHFNRVEMNFDSLVFLDLVPFRRELILPLDEGIVDGGVPGLDLIGVGRTGGQTGVGKACRRAIDPTRPVEGSTITAALNDKGPGVVVRRPRPRNGRRVGVPVYGAGRRHDWIVVPAATIGAGNRGTILTSCILRGDGVVVRGPGRKPAV